MHAIAYVDGAGKGLVLVPPPTQLAWISLNDGQDKSVSNYDFDLFSQDGSGTVRENTVGAGITRGAGAGESRDRDGDPT